MPLKIYLKLLKPLKPPKPPKPPKPSSLEIVGSLKVRNYSFCLPFCRVVIAYLLSLETVVMAGVEKL